MLVSGPHDISLVPNRVAEEIAGVVHVQIDFLLRQADTEVPHLVVEGIGVGLWLGHIWYGEYGENKNEQECFHWLCCCQNGILKVII